MRFSRYKHQHFTNLHQPILLPHPSHLLSDKKDGDSESGALTPLTEAEAEDLGKWLVSTLSEKLQDAKPTSRLYDSPAIVTDHESGALRRMMRMVEQQSMGQASFVPKQHLEINPRHPIIVRLHALRTEDAELATVGWKETNRIKACATRTFYLSMSSNLHYAATKLTYPSLSFSFPPSLPPLGRGRAGV